MPGTHFGEVEFQPVESILFWADLGHSSPGFFGTIQFNLESSAPVVYHLLWSPDPDEGSPIGVSLVDPYRW